MQKAKPNSHEVRRILKRNKNFKKEEVLSLDFAFFHLFTENLPKNQSLQAFKNETQSVLRRKLINLT